MLNTPIRTKRWPDLSMYGLRLISTKLPSGDWRLVLLGGDKYPSASQRLGFKKKSGLWIRHHHEITANELRDVFKQFRVKEMPESDIYRILRPKSRVATQEEVRANIAVNMATPIGTNHLGQEVFHGADGRFIKTGEGKVVNMSEASMSPSIFLRAISAEDLEECADALVMTISRGEVYREEDIDRFADYIFDGKPEDSEAKLSALHVAINHALGRKMSYEFHDAGRNSFNLALKLHEGLPPLSQDLAEYITPLPVGIVAQRLAGITRESVIFSPVVGNGALLSSLGENIKVLTLDDPETSSQVLRSDVELYSIAETEGEQVPHSIMLANFPAEPLDEHFNSYGTKVYRGDHLKVMRYMSAREKHGKSVFLLKAGNVPGEVDQDTKLLLSWMSARYQIEAYVELDGSLFGRGGNANNRYLVIAGDAGQTDNIQFDTARVIYDYQSLWKWADEFVSEQQRLTEKPALEENGYQAPYVPASRIGMATTMIPRNLVGPIREALSRIESEHGSVDDFVSREINMPFSEMEECFSPEQIDAIAMGIAAHKNGKGFIEADQTGLGKGRVLAAMARYAILNNMPTIFMSISDTLFSDFYRDIVDIHSEDLIKPFVLNQGVPLIIGNKRVRRGSKKEEVLEVLESGVLPEGNNLLMATYSQFNRDNKKNTDPKSQFLKEFSKGAFMVMDESHAAAGESNIGFNLLRSLREVSGVVYSSATFAKASQNFRIYSKVMPPSVSPATIPEILSRGGEPLAEVFSSMLAEDAVMIRREHDLSKLKFEDAFDTQYAARNEQFADQLAEILEGMGMLTGIVNHVINDRNKLIAQQFDRLQSMLPRKKGEAKPKFNVRDNGWFSTNIGSRMYQAMRQFFLAIKVDYTVELAVKSLEEGRKPIIALENTFESQLRDAIKTQKEGLDVTDMSLFLQDDPDMDSDTATMNDLIMELDGEDGANDVASADDNILQVPLTFRNVLYKMLDSIVVVRKVGEDAQIERMQNEAIDKLRKSIELKIDAFPDIYISPLDYIKQKLEEHGYSCGEISGRNIGMAFRNDGTQVINHVRKGNKNRTINAFNSGQLDAIILTTSGSTGISLHASAKFEDQRQREMIELQVANNVATRMQMLGRPNRTGQVCAPIIRTVNSGLPSESRMISMQNAKLRHMSANTTSNRENSVIDQDLDILNKVGNQVCLHYLMENQDIAKRLAIDVELLSPAVAEKKSSSFYVDQLTGRLGMLYVHEQRAIYDQILEAYRNEIAYLDSKGINPFKSHEMDVRGKIEDREEIYTPVFNTGSVFDRSVYLTRLTWEQKLDPLTSSQVHNIVKENTLRRFDQNDPGEYMNTIVDTLRQSRTFIIDKAWIRNQYPTLQMAMLDSASSVHATTQRLDFIEKWVPLLIPGNVVQFTSLFGGTKQGLIIDIELPEPGKEDKLGQYRFKLLIPGDGRETMSLYPMIKDDEFKVITDNADVIKQIEEQSPTIRQREMILDGNIFSACAWSVDQNRGTSTIYTNEHGDRLRGVVMPRDCFHVDMHTPFAIDRDVAYQFIMEKYTENVSQWLFNSPKSKPSNSDMNINFGNGRIQIRLPKSKNSIQFIDASAIPEISSSQFKMAKGEKDGIVQINLDPQNVMQLLDEIYENNDTLFAPYQNKDDVMEIFNRINLKKASFKIGY